MHPPSSSSSSSSSPPVLLPQIHLFLPSLHLSSRSAQGKPLQVTVQSAETRRGRMLISPPGSQNLQQPFPLPPLTFWDSPASAHKGKAKGYAGRGSLDLARKGFCTRAKGNKCSEEQQMRLWGPTRPSALR